MVLLVLGADCVVVGVKWIIKRQARGRGGKDGVRQDDMMEKEKVWGGSEPLQSGGWTSRWLLNIFLS